MSQRRHCGTIALAATLSAPRVAAQTNQVLFSRFDQFAMGRAATATFAVDDLRAASWRSAKRAKPALQKPFTLGSWPMDHIGSRRCSKRYDSLSWPRLTQTIG